MKVGDVAIYEDFYRDILVYIDGEETDKFYQTSYSYHLLLNGKASNVIHWATQQKFRPATTEEIQTGINQAELTLNVLREELGRRS